MRLPRQSLFFYICYFEVKLWNHIVKMKYMTLILICPDKEYLYQTGFGGFCFHHFHLGHHLCQDHLDHRCHQGLQCLQDHRYHLDRHCHQGHHSLLDQGQDRLSHQDQCLETKKTLLFIESCLLLFFFYFFIF